MWGILHHKSSICLPWVECTISLTPPNQFDVIWSNIILLDDVEPKSWFLIWKQWNDSSVKATWPPVIGSFLGWLIILWFCYKLMFKPSTYSLFHTPKSRHSAIALQCTIYNTTTMTTTPWKKCAKDLLNNKEAVLWKYHYPGGEANSEFRATNS